MCNLYANTATYQQYIDAFSAIARPLVSPGGVPNLEPRAEVRITERAPVVRAGEGTLELLQMRWSWPGPGGKPVYNFRSEGRRFDHGRCLVPVTGFYEFTAPQAPKQKLKDRWLFTKPGEGLFCIAGLWRPDEGDRPEAFTLLTTAPGPDIAPYHDRQIVVLHRADWERWLDPAAPIADLLQPLPAGSLSVVKDR